MGRAFRNDPSGARGWQSTREHPQCSGSRSWGGGWGRGGPRAIVVVVRFCSVRFFFLNPFFSFFTNRNTSLFHFYFLFHVIVLSFFFFFFDYTSRACSYLCALILFQGNNTYFSEGKAHYVVEIFVQIRKHGIFLRFFFLYFFFFKEDGGVVEG